MILIEDRRSLAQDIATAHSVGARLRLACDVAGIDERTLQRWKAHAGLVKGDGRPQAVHPVPCHALSEQERARLLSVANEPRFEAVPPARIVPMLAEDVPRRHRPSAHLRPTSPPACARSGVGT